MIQTHFPGPHDPWGWGWPMVCLNGAVTKACWPFLILNVPSAAKGYRPGPGPVAQAQHFSWARSGLYPRGYFYAVGLDLQGILSKGLKRPVGPAIYSSNPLEIRSLGPAAGKFGPG